MRPEKSLTIFALAFISSFIFFNPISQAAQAAGKICYSCSPDYVPGSPVSDNKSLSALTLLSSDLLSDKDALYLTDLSLICKEFYDDFENPGAVLKAKTIPDMKKYTPNQKIEVAFLEDGCTPGKIGQALAPIAHLAAEVPGTRLGHLKAIQDYFKEEGKLDFFKKVINAKNTTGYTTLDYVQYLNENGNYLKKYEAGINTFIQFLCDNGGEYSKYKSKVQCDGQKMAVKSK